MRVGIAVEQTLNCPKNNSQFPRRCCNMCFLDIIVARVPEVGEVDCGQQKIVLCLLI